MDFSIPVAALAGEGQEPQPGAKVMFTVEAVLDRVDGEKAHVREATAAGGYIEPVDGAHARPGDKGQGEPTEESLRRQARELDGLGEDELY